MTNPTASDSTASTPLSPTATPVTDPEEFLKLSGHQLDAIFGAHPAGEIPVGEGEGTAIVAPGTSISDEIAKFVHLFGWKGKVFERDEANPGHGFLKNRLLLLGHKAIVAHVYKGPSWFDGKECIILDYSHTSIAAHWIRDEIRQVSPNVYLGLVYGGSKDKEHSVRLIHFALKF